MLKITNFKIDPVETPGLVHSDNLTPESARETTTLLEENNSRYHIFTTTEDDKGVSTSGRCRIDGRKLIVALGNLGVPAQPHRSPYVDSLGFGRSAGDNPSAPRAKWPVPEKLHGHPEQPRRRSGHTSRFQKMHRQGGELPELRALFPQADQQAGVRGCSPEVFSRR